MNQEELQKTIAEYYSKLPTKAQEMFSRMDWMQILDSIATKYILTPNQIQTLGAETTMLLLGIVHPEEYEKTVMNELAVPKDIAGKIVEEVNNTIVKDFRLMLTETYNANTVDIAEKEYGKGKTLDERFANLPYEVRDAIENSDYQKKLYEVASKQKLSIEQMGKLENITNKVLLGLIHPDEFTNNIVSDLGLSTDQANTLTTEINNNIMSSIRTALKTHAENEIKNKSEEIPIPKPPAKIIQPQNTPIQIVTTAQTPILKTEQVPNISKPTNVLGTAGIEMIEDIAEVPQKAQEILNENNMEIDEKLLEKSGVGMIDEKPIIPAQNIPSSSQARNELLGDIENPPVIPTSMVADKLKNPTINTTITKKDPYKEEI